MMTRSDAQLANTNDLWREHQQMAPIQKLKQNRPRQPIRVLMNASQDARVQRDSHRIGR